MKGTLLLLLMLPAVSVGQASSAGVKVAGSCNQVVTGSGNQITLNCNGITKEKADKLVHLMNTILSRQLDPDEVYSQLSQINAKVEGIGLALDPMSGMSASEQAIFEKARQLQTDCYALQSQWLQARIVNIRTVMNPYAVNSDPAVAQAMKDARQAKAELIAAQRTYIARPTDEEARKAYEAAQEKSRHTGEEYTKAMTALTSPVNTSAAADAEFATRYKNDMEKNLIEVRDKMVSIYPNANASGLHPDYSAVKTVENLGNVCTQFTNIGLNAYMGRGQQIRNNVMHPKDGKN